MKDNVDIKLYNTEETINETKETNTNNSFTSIFKLNNGQELAKELSKITGTHYDYLSENSDGFKFINKTGMYIKTDKDGNITNCPEIMTTLHVQQFMEIVKKRLNKTDEMLKGICC